MMKTKSYKVQVNLIMLVQSTKHKAHNTLNPKLKKGEKTFLQKWVLKKNAIVNNNSYVMHHQTKTT
jgi:hypothetical protein